MFKGYALIVTVDAYASPDIPDLDTRVRIDGDDVATTLADVDLCGYDTDRIFRLSGTEATVENIKSALDNLSSRVREDDPVLFFFSGHGMKHQPGNPTSSSLLAQDFDPVTGNGALGSGMLSDMWSALPSRRKLFVADACYSGGLDIAKVSGDTIKLGIDSRILDQLAVGEGSVSIASSKPDELSWLLSGDRNSLFTKYFLAGLKGAAGHDQEGFVRVFDLFTYIAERVRSQRSDQSPIYCAQQQDSNFPVSYCALPARRKSRDTIAPTPMATANIGEITALFSVLYPLGPLQLSLWERAGGDVSRLTLTGNGRSDWFQAIKLISLGGGGRVYAKTHSSVRHFRTTRTIHNCW